MWESWQPCVEGIINSWHIKLKPILRIDVVCPNMSFQCTPTFQLRLLYSRKYFYLKWNSTRTSTRASTLQNMQSCHTHFSKWDQKYFIPRGHLYIRLDTILIKGLSKHTLSTYFAGIDPKYALLHAFFLIFPTCHFQNLWTLNQKHTLSSYFAPFCTPKICTHVHCLVLKIFFYKDDIQLQIHVPPRLYHSPF